jgi:hypothetical protein
MHIEQFKETLRKICTQVEELWIEKETYWEFIISKGMGNPHELQRIADQALADPETRKRTREEFSGMWKALEEVGTAAWLEDILKDGPASKKWH